MHKCNNIIFSLELKFSYKYRRINIFLSVIIQPSKSLNVYTCTFLINHFKLSNKTWLSINAIMIYNFATKISTLRSDLDNAILHSLKIIFILNLNRKKSFRVNEKSE